MFYEPYEKKRGGGRWEEPRRRRGCAVRLLGFVWKLVWRLALLLVVLAVIAYALPPGLFNVEPETDLALTTGLPDTCVNILLLGVDALNHGAQRSDAVMILSVGYNSLKLTSILRDITVDIEGHGQGKINGAYAYGGAELAMRTVNQAFSMNITKYAVVDFLTLARLVDAVGGVDLVVTEAEMKQVNRNNARVAGSAEAKAALGYAPGRLTAYSADGKTPVHLDGLQALGYARIRKIDSDYSRTARQRKVVSAVLAAAKKQAVNPLMYARLIGVLRDGVQTNLRYAELASLAVKALVCGEAEQLRLPVEGSYTDNGSRITIDKAKNAEALRRFIYEN